MSASHVTFVARSRAPQCSYCHDRIALRDQTWRCLRCKTLLHLPCVEEHGGCVLCDAPVECEIRFARVEEPPRVFGWRDVAEYPLVPLLSTWNLRYLVDARLVALCVAIVGCTFACLSLQGGMLGGLHGG